MRVDVSKQEDDSMFLDVSMSMIRLMHLVMRPGVPM